MKAKLYFRLPKYLIGAIVMETMIMESWINFVIQYFLNQLNIFVRCSTFFVVLLYLRLNSYNSINFPYFYHSSVFNSCYQVMVSSSCYREPLYFSATILNRLQMFSYILRASFALGTAFSNFFYLASFLVIPELLVGNSLNGYFS